MDCDASLNLACTLALIPVRLVRVLIVLGRCMPGGSWHDVDKYDGLK